MDTKAYIHSIETCGTVDGPGLRYVVFFQGCTLRCVYCHNPDTWRFGSGIEMTVTDILEDALRYKSYMKYSGGGFTACGGEPLAQAAFLSELFRKLQKNGIHTTLDTAGSMQFQDTKELLAHTDLVLLDVKAFDQQKYSQLTGGDFSQARAFAEYLNKKQIPAWARYVVIPGLTDADSDMISLASYLNDFTNIQKVELLPFHKMGETKWEALELPYTLSKTLPPKDKKMDELTEIFYKHWNGKRE